MKKKYQNLGDVLSRSEIKQKIGGISELQSWTCTFTNTDGSTVTLDIPGTNGNQSQCKADAICWGSNQCLTVDCAGSGAC